MTKSLSITCGKQACIIITLQDGILFYVLNHSRYIPCMLAAQKNYVPSKDNIFHSKSMYPKKRF